MITKIKNLVKKKIKSMGYELCCVNNMNNPMYSLVVGLDHFKVDLVLDVGANIGQFARELRSFNYKGKIVSFEPLSQAYKQLSAFAINDPLWTVHTRCAVGESDGELEINVSNNSVSSSILPMLESHSKAAPNSSYIGKESVPVVCLDSIAGQYVKESDSFFIKIDTQGYEWEVLNGAEKTLSNARGVLCELSILPLYEGQHLWREIIVRLELMGFRLWTINKGFADSHSGRLLQIDAIFFRI